MARFEVPDGMTVQAFQFTLDPAPAGASMVRRQFGGRRYACNWAVRTMKADIAAFHATGTGSPAPSLFGPRKRWYTVKDTECVDISKLPRTPATPPLGWDSAGHYLASHAAAHNVSLRVDHP